MSQDKKTAKEMMLVGNCVDELYERYTVWYRIFQQSNSHLCGRLLTLFDASFADPQQRKAFKDLVSQELERNFIERQCNHLIFLYNEISEIFRGKPLFPNNIDSKNLPSDSSL